MRTMSAVDRVYERKNGALIAAAVTTTMTAAAMGRRRMRSHVTLSRTVGTRDG
jgi:hypothetical protein